MASFKVLLLFFVSVLLRANSTYHTTPYEIGPGRMTRDFVSATTLSATDYHVFDLPILAWATQTGGTVTSTNGVTGGTGVKYASICLPNPFKRMGTGTGRTFLNIGSGGVLEAVYINKANPAGVGGDLGFVDGCENGTGSTIIDNVCTGTGCNSQYIANGTSMAVWQGAEYLKLGLRGNPTSAFRAILHLRLMSLDK